MDGSFSRLDEFEFFSTKDPVRAIYRAVDICVLIFGLSLNSLLIYLIRTKTVGTMRIYKNLLLISCGMDLLVSLWNYIVQPIPCVEHGYRTVILNGWFRNAPLEIRYALYLTWIQLLLFFLITTMSQYVYRYCILCHDGQVPAHIFWTLAFAQIGLNVGHACILAWADYPREEEAPVMEEMKQRIFNGSGITDIQFAAFGNATSFRWLTHIAIMCVMFPGFYLVIGICSLRIRREVEHMNVLNLREHNKQVSAALLFQALLPTFEIASWCVQIFVPMFVSDKSTVLYIVFSDIPIHLVPALNPLGTILLVAPYRRALFDSFAISKAKNTLIRLQSHLGSLRAGQQVNSVEAMVQHQSTRRDYSPATMAMQKHLI